MKKRSFFFRSSFSKFLLFAFLIGCIACNSNDKKEDSSSSTSTAANNTVQKDTGKVASLIGNFRQYKLTQATIQALEGNPKKAKLLLLKIKLDDLSDPTNMTLWGYPAKDHHHYAEAENPQEILPDGNPVLVNDTKNLFIGNNELAFKYFHKDENLNKPFLDFTYILLTPHKRADGNLVFTISAYKGLTLIANLVPAETNPSPPAPPEEN